MQWKFLVHSSWELLSTYLSHMTINYVSYYHMYISLLEEKDKEINIMNLSGYLLIRT